MHVAESLRSARESLGITQSELARSAGVSLATVQNTERGRANPALGTLERLGRPLGLAVRLEPQPADWSALIALGLPLSGPPRRLPVRDAATLRLHIARAAVEMARTQESGGAVDERRREALCALVVAAEQHFPEVTRGWIERTPAVRTLAPDAVPGRIVKLSRIAVAALAEYL